MSLPMGITPLGPVPPAPTASELQPSADPPLGAAVYALLRFRGLVTASTLLGAVLGLGAGLMRPNSFTSTGTLLLRSGAREAATAETAVAGRESQEPRPFDVLANEIEILSHRDAVRGVIERVGVARILEVYDPAAEDDAETSVLARALHRLQTWWFANSTAALQTASPERRQFLALQTLMTRLSLRPSGSSLIRVSYEAHTAELAKEITDAFLAAAEEHHRQVFSNRTSFEFLLDLDQKAVAAAKAATDALLEFKQKNGILDLGVQRTALVGDIAKLETQFAADDEQLQAQEGRCNSLRQLLATETPFEEVVTDAPPKENPEYTALQQQITSLTSQETTIRSSEQDRPEMERRVKALGDLLAAVELRLQSVPPTIPGPKSRQTVKNPRYERLRALLDEDELKAVALRVMHDRQAARLEKMRTRLEGLEQVGPRYEALVAEVAKHQDDSRRFLENLKKTELLNLLDEHKLSNLQILQAGDLPMKKSGPNRSLWTLVGTSFGFMLGLCVAFVRHRLDGSVRRAQDLESAGTEVLGVVPEIKAVAAQGASLGDLQDESLRHRLDSVWGGMLPARIPRDSRSIIALVGDEHSPGVTTLALHFAARAARCLHVEVLLVETNYHHATLARRLGLDGSPGFAELIGGTASREQVVRSTEVPGLRIVHAGACKAAVAGLQAGRRPEELLRSLTDGFQIVLLDVPSIVGHPEFRQLAWSADLVVPVFAAGRSTKDGVRGLLHAIESARKYGPGAILNRWRSVRPFWVPRALDV